MAESQIVKKVQPSIKTSSMDSHKMLTHPDQTPPRRGSQKPHHPIGKPLKPGEQPVQFKATPIRAEMKGGGAIAVDEPRTLRRATQPPRPELAQNGASEHVNRTPVLPSSSPLTREMATLAMSTVDAYIERLPSDSRNLSLARATFQALAKLAR